MKRSLGILVWLGILMGIFILFSGQTMGQWVCEHGVAGKVEFKDRVQNTNRHEFGWGLDITAKPGLGNWYHWSVPGNAGRYVKKIRIKAWMGSVDVRIIQVHLWNGGSKVQEFKDLDWTPGHLNEVLVLKTPQKFTNGVGVSVNIGAGVENMNHRFTVANVCALYAPTPGK